MTIRFSGPLAYAAQELGRIRLDITHAATASLSSQLAERERCATIKAYCYVWLAATVEKVVRDSLREILVELTQLQVSSCDIRASLFGLLCDGEISSIRDRKRQAGWSTRVSMFSRTVDHAPAVFSPETLPIDGRTLGGDHFETIWLVFGFAGRCLPSPLHRAALKDLVEGRNSVAHGNVEPVAFGKSKAISDLHKLTERVDEILSHILAAMDEYMVKKLFRK